MTSIRQVLKPSPNVVESQTTAKPTSVASITTRFGINCSLLHPRRHYVMYISSLVICNVNTETLRAAAGASAPSLRHEPRPSRPPAALPQVKQAPPAQRTSCSGSCHWRASVARRRAFNEAGRMLLIARSTSTQAASLKLDTD